ncbi:MAG: hypothetical protein ACPGUV_05965 [Polyangiales bacterium]
MRWLLAISVWLGGCQLIADFDRSRLSEGDDAGDGGTDAGVDAGDASLAAVGR